jgi:hypothetical protein
MIARSYLECHLRAIVKRWTVGLLGLVRPGLLLHPVCFLRQRLCFVAVFYLLGTNVAVSVTPELSPTILVLSHRAWHPECAFPARVLRSKLV